MVVFIHPSDEKAWVTFKGVTKRLDEGGKRDGQKLSATLFWWCADKGIRLANEEMYSKATTYFERASYCYEGAGHFQKELDLELSVRTRGATLSARNFDNFRQECYNFYAICLHHIGDPAEQVLPWFEMAVRLNPANYIAWANKGITVRVCTSGHCGKCAHMLSQLEKLGRPMEAMDCYANALRVKPNYERAHVNFCMLGRRLSTAETKSTDLEGAVAL
jgi:tetratricopeptide (TPR) repeat protein